MSKLIELVPYKGQPLNVLVSDEDYPMLSQYRWRAKKNRNTFYAITSTKKTITMQRMVMGFPSREYLVDHRDGNGLNNTRENLRITTTRENSCNRLGNKNTQLNTKGVSPLKNGKYKAYIHHMGKQICLGTHSTIELAQQAYNAAAKVYHGVYHKPSIKRLK